MPKVELGTYLSGGNFCLDIDRLIETRLVVQASSGGSKSYPARKIIELMGGRP
jgi:hypothetical protein